MACDCIDMINAELAKRNGELGLSFTLSGEVFPTLVVSKKDKKNRTRPPLVAPTFCPFCGSKYAKEVA